MLTMTREELIYAATSPAAQVQRPLSRALFKRVTGIHQAQFYRRFPDSG